MTRSIPTAYLLIVAALYAALQICLGAASLTRSTWMVGSVVAMIVCAGLMVAVLIPRHPAGLPRPLAVAVVVGTVAVTLLVQAGLPGTAWPGYAAWHPAALQCLLVVVALRRSLAAALLGCALFVGCTLWWSLASVGGIGFGVRITLAPVLFVLIAVALARFLATNDRRAEEQTTRALALLDQAAAAETQRSQAQSWAQEVAVLAEPSLRIAADVGSELTDEDRTRMREVEVALRDRIRGGDLATPPVLAAVARARSRGVEVTLLDDREAGLPERTVRDLARAVAALEPGLAPGRLTIRARPWPATPPEVTIAFSPDDPDAEPLYAEIPARDLG